MELPASAPEVAPLPPPINMDYTLPFESAVMASYISEKIIRRMEGKMLIHSVDRRLPLYSSMVGMSTVKSLIKSVTVAHDQGETSGISHCWSPSLEPV